MRTAKSAGSPAFLPPELCGKHGDVKGTAVDIWSMGVSLYCLKYGKIPFNRDGMLQIFEAIKNDEPSLPDDESPDLVDLLRRLMDKDPEQRINMPEIRVRHTAFHCAMIPQ
jgi:[calcium/calmodulin-dependent protein kinase] kinase